MDDEVESEFLGSLRQERHPWRDLDEREMKTIGGGAKNSDSNTLLASD
jgi:hypothetical protein